MSLRALFGGASKCRTIDVCDIFGDGSGKALYRLDGNANDESGNYHGTETGTPVYGGGAFERGVVSSSTNTNYITTASIPSGSIKSVSLWIYPTALPTDATWHTIYMNTGASANTNGALLRYVSSGLYALEVYFNIGGTRYYTTTNPQTTIPLNSWTNVTVCLESNNTISVYKNGTAIVTSTPTTSGAIAYNGSLVLGQYNTNGSYNAYVFRGSIDQFRIFNRALTASEVQTLYTECAPTSTVDNINPFEDGSLKALYQFDGDATDKTGVYNGTATNVTYGTGKFGQCAVFNGSALVSTSFTLSTNVFSYSGWFKVTTPSSTIQSLIDFTTNRAMLSSGNGTNAYVSYYDGVTYRTFSAYTLPANTFVFLSLVINGTTAYLYADGILKGTSSCTAVVPSGGMYLGRYAGSSSGFLTGSQDQVRIFNKALTPMEVASLYTETTPMEEPMHSLVDPFKDGSGKALYRLDGNALDESGNYNGTATNVTYGSAQVGREAIFNGSASITATLALSANTFSYSVWATVTTVGSTIQSIIDFSTGRAMLSSGNGTNAYLSYYDGTAYRVFGTYALTSATRTHIGLAVNGTSVELFINGVSQGTSACNAVTPSGTIALGKYAGSASGYLTGRENQTRIFNRVLTASEFSQLYNQGA